MRAFWLFIIVALVNVSVHANRQENPKAQFEVVESVPLETQFGSPGVRRTQAVWLQMINQAKHSIDLGAFYLDQQSGRAFEPILKALKAAANRGVRIRILIDASMRSQSASAVDLLKNQDGITIRYLPMGKIDGGILHAKYLVVDQINTFVGSQNFDWKSISHVHEIGLRVENRALAKTILRVFNMDWALSQKPTFSNRNHYVFKRSSDFVSSQRPVRVCYHNKVILIHPAFSPQNLLPSGLDWEQTQLVHLIRAAHHRLLLQVLQFSPFQSWGRKGYWFALDNAIRSAAARGVHVKLIVSDWNLKYPAVNYLKSLTFLPNIKVKYSHIPQYSRGFISYARVEHAKYVVVDNDLIWVGTGNWEWSYFNDTRDLALIVQGKEPNQILSGIFMRDWAGPYTHRLDPNTKYRAPKTH